MERIRCSGDVEQDLYFDMKDKWSKKSCKKHALGKDLFCNLYFCETIGKGVFDVLIGAQQTVESIIDEISIQKRGIWKSQNK